MIKINLASRKQAVSSGEEGASKTKGTGLSSARDQLEMLKDIPLRKVAIYLGIALAGSFLMDSTKEDDLAKWNRRTEKVRTENANLQAQLAKTKAYEEMKKQLEADELLIRSKLEVVKKLVDGRQTPSNMLMTLSSGVPKEIWLSEFKLIRERVSIKGLAANYNHISDFMKTLGESAFFSDLVLVNTAQDRDDLGGGEIANFDLSAKRRAGQ